MSWEDTYKDSYMYLLGKNLDENADGHVWKRDDVIYPDGYVPPDVFAYQMGYHNGPVCESCGFSYCIHCPDEVSACLTPRPELLDLLVKAVKIKR